MQLSLEDRPGEDQAIATIHAALDAGITLIDTADAYHARADDVGHNEELVASALRSYGGDTSDVLVATKGGHVRPGDGSWQRNGSPDHLKAAAEASAKRLAVDAIDLYQFHRPDPKVPYAESIGALAALLEAGTIRAAGISNASMAQIDEAYGILGERLVSVQNQFSPSFRSSAAELRRCDALGLAFLPWAPLGSAGNAGGLGETHRAFRLVAQARGVSPQQVALAWELAQSPCVIPIPGSSRPQTIRDSALAADLELSADELAELNGN